MRYATCHPDKKHFATDLCKVCYYQQKNAEYRSQLSEEDHERKRQQSRDGYYRRRDNLSADVERRPDTRTPWCHPERRHYARGLCSSCYGELQRHQDRFGQATCHPDKPHVARGLCAACYSAWRYREHAEEERDKQHANRKRAAAKIRAEMLEAYGPHCACPKCPETNPAFLTLDHINGGGRKHREEANSGGGFLYRIRDEGWPKDKYRLLCWNCNAAVRYGRICPHMALEE